MKQVHVAAAVILKSDKVFIAKRSQTAHQGGLWEFPGGKVEVGETAEQALKRELLEEIGIEINGALHFIAIPFEYPDKSVLLDVFLVTDFMHDPWGKEGQVTQWFDIEELKLLSFPAANRVIIDRLCKEFLN
jgi:8-oxo-dGTP diphosphatase